MSVKRRVPELRFRGFSGEWAKKELSSICSMNARIGWQNLRTSEFLDSGDYYLITGTDFENGRVNFNTCHYVEKYRYTQDKKIQVTNGNILITKDGTLGKVAYVDNMDKPATLNAGVFNVRTKSKNIDKKYIFQYLKAPFLMNYVDEKATGGTIKHLNQNILVNFPVKIPDIKEQTKIGNYFQNLDKLIEQKEKKHQKLGQLKKAMLEKMFPKDGANTPEIRFKGFSGEWDEKNLGEYAKFRRGSFPQPYGRKEWYDGENAMPFVQVVDVNKTLSLVDDTKQKISLLAQPKSVLVKEGTVVVTLQGSIGRVAILQYDAYVDRTLLIFESFKNKTDIHYWAYLIQRLFEKEKKKAPGGTIKTITKDALSSFQILIPSLEEETKIGNYFQKIDHLIDLQHQELQKLKNIKKASLAKMFA